MKDRRIVVPKHILKPNEVKIPTTITHGWVGGSRDACDAAHANKKK